jgi:peptidoglycan hydrolase-like protein with peptidoglycan-binding domain
VTTYRIERSDDTPTASIPVPNATPAPAIVPAARAAPAVAETVAVPAADPVLTQIQTILAGKGLYQGEIDGLMGPKSAAAIRAWEKANGYTETGEATTALLAIMDQEGARPAPVEVTSAQPAARPAPIPRPAPAVVSDTRAGEPVTVPAVAAEGPSELVRQIQSGLSNIAYADITVDGVAGSQTRAAISAFEKHYRLPVTGEPNETVLNKLLEIGAL